MEPEGNQFVVAYDKPLPPPDQEIESLVPAEPSSSRNSNNNSSKLATVSRNRIITFGMAIMILFIGIFLYAQIDEKAESFEEAIIISANSHNNHTGTKPSSPSPPPSSLEVAPKEGEKTENDNLYSEEEKKDEINTSTTTADSDEKTDVQVDTITAETSDNNNNNENGIIHTLLDEAHHECIIKNYDKNIHNIALKKKATASSTNRQYGGEPNRAVDGITNQNWSSNSVTATNDECQPWWLVELSETNEALEVHRVLIYNRKDCCPERLNNFYVELLDRSSPDDKEWTVVKSLFHPGAAASIVNAEFPPNSKGKAIRVKLKDCGYVSLAEVEVYPPDKTIQDNVQGCHDTALQQKKEEEEQHKKAAKEKIEANLNTDWGVWDLTDSKASSRPKDEDFLKDYPNKDIPIDKFPKDAWQTDPDYVRKFVDQSQLLVKRAMKAILSEYGRAKHSTDEEMAEAMKMFYLHKVDIAAGENLPDGWGVQGGWTSQRSMDGLVRRLLHALITRDTFTVVMGGHSAAAAHGNHFKQSYMMQFHYILEPIFARLGVKLMTRNMGQGGLGTMQNALGSRDIYGDDIDVMVWDSSMTENALHEFDLFCRQALLGSKRAPFILCKNCAKVNAVLKTLHEKAGADIGEAGTGKFELLQTKDSLQVLSLPYAVQYMNCEADMVPECKEHRYNSTCWVQDGKSGNGIVPSTKQEEFVGGRAGWHPGNREHQLDGRVLTMWILQALDMALTTWSKEAASKDNDNNNNPVPAIDHWHMTEHYSRIHKSLIEMDDSYCESGSPNRYPKRVCRIALYGATEYTPRANPESTSMISIIKPSPDGYVPSYEAKLLYEGEERLPPAMIVPEGEVDVFAIVSASTKESNRKLLSSSYPHDDQQQIIVAKPLSKDDIATTTATTTTTRIKMTTEASTTHNSNQRHLGDNDAIVPGRGWVPYGYIGHCDGSWYSSTCNRDSSNSCLLSGHNDMRGGLKGDGLSGWLVMTLRDVKEGIIIGHIDYWHGDNKRTESWTEVNDGKRKNIRRRNIRDLKRQEDIASITTSSNNNEISSSHLLLHPDDNNVDVYNNDQSIRRKLDFDKNYVFEYAINGKIYKTIEKSNENNAFNENDEYKKRYSNPERVVELFVFLDDPQFISSSGEDKAAQDIEFAFRIRGCERKDCNIAINHIYWA